MAEPKPIDPQKEIEIQVHELEERVDRLRAIYEQYFMGYEKLEPTVPRKDVDRRFVQLRKANIRNTALRFRFNVVTQKFNTYAMYWTRICRQIEEGTFKRHIQRANRRFGGPRERNDELSIDVELGDFEVDMDDFDMDAAAAEAEPTIPPGPASKGESSKRAAAAGIAPTDDDLADTTPPSAPRGADPHRVARHAVLPAGSRGRVLVKKGGPLQPGQPVAEGARARMPSITDEAPPPSMRARMPSVPEVPPPSMRARMPSVVDAPPSTSVIRAATAQPGGHVHRPPPGVVRPQISPSAQSVRRVQVARPVEQPPASTGHIPAATPQAPPPSSPAVPPPAARPAAPTSIRIPVGLPSSVNRAPAAGPATPGPPAAPPAAAPAPTSERRLPIPPPSQRNPVARPATSAGAMPAAPPVRPPAPSVPESESRPRSRRPPPPLPSQSKKD